MKKILVVTMMLFSQASMAFTSNDEQIDYVLEIMQNGPQTKRLKVLERLQWSTLSEARLYDTFEQNLIAHYKKHSIDKAEKEVLRYQIRALAYSGNPKYKSTLEAVEKDADNRSLRSTARRALKDYPNFLAVQNALSGVQSDESSLPSEVANYLKLLKTDNSYAQRLAARALFHEGHMQPVVIKFVADSLKKEYQTKGLPTLKQDTLAWYCKVLKNAGGYDVLLDEIEANTPYNKIRKHAAKR